MKECEVKIVWLFTQKHDFFSSFNNIRIKWQLFLLTWMSMFSQPPREEASATSTTSRTVFQARSCRLMSLLVKSLVTKLKRNDFRTQRRGSRRISDSPRWWAILVSSPSGLISERVTLFVVTVYGEDFSDLSSVIAMVVETFFDQLPEDWRQLCG